MLTSDIIRRAALLFDVTPEQILDDNRRRNVHRARLATYMALWMRATARGVEHKYKPIGRSMGGRDHSTIIHGIKRAREEMDKDPEFTKAVIDLATMDKNTPLKKPSCKPPLQKVQVQDQQPKRAKPVLDPELIEEKINAALCAAKIRSIEVYWDGNIVTEMDPATFEVFKRDEPTRLIVRYDKGFHIQQRMRHSRLTIHTVNTPGLLADALRSEIYKEEEAA